MEKILSDIFSNKIIFPEKCKTCKCFEEITETHKFYKILNYKYHCILMEGDIYCEFIQNNIDNKRKYIIK